jgi:hypothetical protein
MMASRIADYFKWGKKSPLMKKKDLFQFNLCNLNSSTNVGGGVTNTACFFVNKVKPPNSNHLSITTTSNLSQAILFINKPLDNDHLSIPTSGHLSLVKEEKPIQND